jgi:UDP-galactopyranose mutase
MKYDVLVIGAGLAGASAARILAEQNKKILVIEKNLYVGGNCYDERDGAGITVHRYGPHIFHTQSRILWQFVNRFSPFRHYQHVVKAYVDGMLVTFPINRDTICELFGASITTDEVNAFLQSEIETASFDPEPKNFRDAIVSQVGERLYNKFFKNYTWKQWEQDPINLSVELAGRIPVRQNRDARYFTDPYQGIPEEGYTGMIQNMLTHENIELILGADYFLDRPSWTQGGKTTETVYTGPLDRYFDYEFGPLQYRSVHFDFQTLDQAIYQPVSVVNYPNDYDFTRITEFKHMTGEKSDKTVICREYPSSVGYPSYVVLTEPNIRIREQYMKKALKEEVQDGVHFIGRLAEYKYYNMDQVIASAMTTFKG